jgi:hypothetical protein
MFLVVFFRLLNGYGSLGVQELLQWPEAGWNDAEFNDSISKP